MTKYIASIIFCGLIFSFLTFSASGQKFAVYSYPVEIELTVDQGDLPVKDYLKNYSTKGKKQGVEKMYEIATPFIVAQFKKANMELLSIDTLAPIRANEYGMPSTTLNKVIGTGIADQYIKIYLKDITMPNVEGLTQQDPNAQQKKIVKMRCRIQIYDAKKELLKDVEGVFQSGEKIDNPSEVGVDLRKYAGTPYLQELKIYETCTKMAILRAMALLK